MFETSWYTSTGKNIACKMLLLQKYCEDIVRETTGHLTKFCVKVVHDSLFFCNLQICHLNIERAKNHIFSSMKNVSDLHILFLLHLNA